MSNAQTPVRDGRRRLSAGFALQVSRGDLFTGTTMSPSPNSPLAVRPNDDASEKLRRRQDKAARRSLMMNVIASDNEPLPSNIDLSNLYSDCIKLSTENKINQKNTWSLGLIDYINEALDHQELGSSGETTNFQLASCTLDASVKIYAYRVDSVHSETYKVLTGLSRSERSKTKTAHDDDDDDDGDDDGDKDNEGHSSKGKKKRSSGRTLESNPKKIQLESFDLAFEVDPLFSKTSMAFDEGGASGMLLNHLSVSYCGEIVFDSCDFGPPARSLVLSSDASAALSDASSSFLDLSDLLDARLTADTDLVICPPFATFQFNDDHGLSIDALDTSDYTGNMIGNDNHEEYYDEMGDGENADNLFGTEHAHEQQEAQELENMMLHDIIVAESNDNSDGFGTAPHSATCNDLAMGLTSLTIRDDYSYFSGMVLRDWAGPDHWKARPNFAMRTGGHIVDSAGRRKRREKKEFRIDFSSKQVPDEAFALSRSSTTLSQATLDRAAATTLPQDIHYGIEDLTRLFCKPQWSTLPNGKSDTRKNTVRGFNAGDGSDGHEEWYDYDNNNDRDNFCPDLGFNDDDGDEHIDGFTGDDALIAEPRKVARIDINYAKTAKRVDVRKLKEKIWGRISNTINEDNLEDKAVSTIDDSKQVDQRVVETPKSFATLVDQLNDSSHQRKLDPSIDKDNSLSASICFVCLLHIANEKTLSISNVDGFGDLVISQG